MHACRALEIISSICFRIFHLRGAAKLESNMLLAAMANFLEAMVSGGWGEGRRDQLRCLVSR